MDASSIGAVVTASVAAVAGGIFGVVKILGSSNGTGSGTYKKVCADHGAICEQIRIGNGRFDRVEKKIDEQRELIFQTSLDVGKIAAKIDVMHERGQ